MTVVVGYVPSREGEAALSHALEAAEARRSRLVVVNTSRGDALVDRRYAQPDQVDDLRRRLEASGLDHVLLHSISGQEAADELLAVAEEHRADLVVLGLRRRSAVGKLILGSTAQKVLLQARCPVLAVKAAPG